MGRIWVVVSVCVVAGLWGRPAQGQPVAIKYCGPFDGSYPVPASCPEPVIPPGVTLVATLRGGSATSRFPCNNGGLQTVERSIENIRIYRYPPPSPPAALEAVGALVYDFVEVTNPGTNPACGGPQVSTIVSRNNVEDLTLGNFAAYAPRNGGNHPLDIFKFLAPGLFHRGTGQEAVLDFMALGQGEQGIGTVSFFDLCRSDELAWGARAVRSSLAGGVQTIMLTVKSDRRCFWAVHKGLYKATTEVEHNAYTLTYRVGLRTEHVTSELSSGYGNLALGYGSGTYSIALNVAGAPQTRTGTIWVNDVPLTIVQSASPSTPVPDIIGPISSGSLSDTGGDSSVCGATLPITTVAGSLTTLKDYALPLQVRCIGPNGEAVDCNWRALVTELQSDVAIGGHLRSASFHDPLKRRERLHVNGVPFFSVTRTEAPDGEIVLNSGANPVGGRLTLAVDCADGSCMPVNCSLDIRVPGLVAVANTADLVVRGKTPSHAQNQFADPALKRALTRAARNFRTRLAQSSLPPSRRPRLVITDISLPYGGVFDVKPAGNWLKPHGNHSTGASADIRIDVHWEGKKRGESPNEPDTALTKPELIQVQRYLGDALESEGVIFFPVDDESPCPGGPTTCSADHYHVQLEASSRQQSPVTAAISEGRITSANVCALNGTPAQARVTGTSTPDGAGSFTYAYTLVVDAASGSGIDAFGIRVGGAVTDLVAPAGWLASVAGVGAESTVFFSADGPLASGPSDNATGDQWLSVAAVPPGNSLSGFSFRSAYAPGTATFSASGVSVLPLLSEEDAEAYADACGAPAGATGETIGPVVPLTAAFLAEGVDNAFFETRLALLNPSADAGDVTLTFAKDDGTQVVHTLSVPARGRSTVYPGRLPALGAGSYSTSVASTSPVVVDRTITWDRSGYGSHAETALLAPSTTWYLAEGATSGEFALFYLLQNPGTTPVTATIRYLLPFGQAPIELTYVLPPHSRTTIPVDDAAPALALTDVSAVVSATAPIIVERAMYRSTATQQFTAGHGSAAVSAPATRWFLAEGATGPFFDLFILIANPNNAAAGVRVDYLLVSGEVLTKHYTVPGNGRHTIWVDDEEIVPGSGVKPLINVAVSSIVTSTNDLPIIVERAMWWPSPELSPNYWTEAHNSPGATQSGTRWALAEGEIGGTRQTETYILVANTSPFAGQARVTLVFEEGGSAERIVSLAPTSRTNVNVRDEFPESVGRRFGALIESLGATPPEIVVERAMYTSPNGQTWAAGTNALATRLP